MELNLTPQHLYSFLLMALAGSWLFRGDKLVRFIGFAGMWQLLTQVRPWYEDVPLMLISFGCMEFFYLRLRVASSLYPRKNK